MVKIGHRIAGREIDSVLFAHSQHPRLGLEVLTLAELRRRVPARHRTRFSRPDFHQLVLVHTGECEHQIDFTRHRCRAGSVLHLRPGQVQRFVQDGSAEGIAMLFRADFLPVEAALRPVRSALLGAAVELPASVIASVDAAATALSVSYDRIVGRELSVSQVSVLQHLLVALLLQIADAATSANASVLALPPHGRRLYMRFLEALEDNFASSREVSLYAKSAKCSAKTLARVCSAMAGASPKELIERRVVLEAQRLLAHSMDSVADISGALGFSEPTNFVKFFKRAQNMTPAAWRTLRGDPNR